MIGEQIKSTVMMTDTTILTNPDSNSEKAILVERPNGISAPTQLRPLARTIERPQRLEQLTKLFGLLARPSQRDFRTCDQCHLRVICKCAQENFRADVAFEQKVWTVLSVCGAVSVLYAAYSFLSR
jgi:hypothetical protein